MPKPATLLDALSNRQSKAVGERGHNNRRPNRARYHQLRLGHRCLAKAVRREKSQMDAADGIARDRYLPRLGLAGETKGGNHCRLMPQAPGGQIAKREGQLGQANTPPAEVSFNDAAAGRTRGFPQPESKLTPTEIPYTSGRRLSGLGMTGVAGLSSSAAANAAPGAIVRENTLALIPHAQNTTNPVRHRIAARTTKRAGDVVNTSTETKSVKFVVDEAHVRPVPIKSSTSARAYKIVRPARRNGTHLPSRR